MVTTLPNFVGYAYTIIAGKPYKLSMNCAVFVDQ